MASCETANDSHSCQRRGPVSRWLFSGGAAQERRGDGSEVAMRLDGIGCMSEARATPRLSLEAVLEAALSTASMDRAARRPGQRSADFTPRRPLMSRNRLRPGRRDPPHAARSRPPRPRARRCNAARALRRARPPRRSPDDRPGVVRDHDGGDNRIWRARLRRRRRRRRFARWPPTGRAPGAWAPACASTPASPSACRAPAPSRSRPPPDTPSPSPPP